MPLPQKTKRKRMIMSGDRQKNTGNPVQEEQTKDMILSTNKGKRKGTTSPPLIALDTRAHIAIVDISLLPLATQTNKRLACLEAALDDLAKHLG